MRFSIALMLLAISFNTLAVKTINLTTAGTLSTELTSLEKDTITSIIITGNIDQRDFSTLNTAMPSLTSINLENANIVAYSSHPANRIPNAAFGGKTKLKSIILPSTTTWIFDFAFNACSALTSIIIPSQVSSIGYGIFQDCTGLSSVNIPASVTDIKSSAFIGCTALTNISVDAGNTYYSNDGGVLFNKSKTMLVIFPAGKSGAYNIPATVTSLDSYSFNTCKELTSIFVPASVTSISISTFNRCSKLAIIDVDNANTIYKSVDGVLYSKDMVTLYRVPEGKSGVFSIPTSVDIMNTYSMFNCSNITSVIIPNSVKTIKSNALSGCLLLTSLEIPNSVTNLEGNSIVGCTNLETVILSNSLTSIKNSTFLGCTSLSNINFPTGILTIGDGAFSNCSSLDTIEIPEYITAISNNTFNNCIGLKSVIFPANLTSIGDYAFHSCTSLKTITIPEKVTSIGSQALGMCSGLTEIITKAETPANLSSSFGVFDNINKTTCKLYVINTTARNLYRNANQWSAFSNIIVSTSLFSKTITSENLKIYANGEYVIIEGVYKQCNAAIIDMSGRMIKTAPIEIGRNDILFSQKGVFLVTVENVCKKIVMN